MKSSLFITCNLLFHTLFIFFMNNSYAQDSQFGIPKDPCENNKHEACKLKSRLSALKPNYVILQKTENDENAIEVRYSFRYLLTRPHCRIGEDYIENNIEQTTQCIKDYSERWEAFFSYTGEFDFYAGTRVSGPVINRISNPGFHYRQYIADSIYQYLDLGLEHRSNGQVTEIDELDGTNLKTQIAYNAGDHEYFDGISRGANYWILESKFKFSPRSRLYISAKYYIDHDSEVNWGPDALDNPSIEDYDRLRFLYEHRWKGLGKRKNKSSEVSFEWVVGDDSTNTDSFNVDWMYPFGLGSYSFPVYLRIHFGPMNTLSNYTLNQDSIGIGIKLRPF